ncbi:hypothetical protein FRC12_012235, partial [Ceratobasidium sp. 428]
MAKETRGPRFSEYSRSEFEPPIPDVSDQEVQAFYNTHGMHSLASLEASLRKLDPRSLAPGSINMGDIKLAIDNYMAVNGDCRIFKYYYGFVCVRHLLHHLCLIFLERRSTLSRLCESIPGYASWTVVSRTVAARALDLSAAMMLNPTLHDELGKLFVGSPYFGTDTLGKAYFSSIVELLWNDRDSFLTLCSLNLLPGCGLFLAIAFRATFFDVDEVALKQNAPRLRDLMFRVYLVGSDRDRHIFRCSCKDVLEFAIPRNNSGRDFISQEDSLTIARAYSGLLSLWQRTEPIGDRVPTGITLMLSGYVLCVSAMHHRIEAQAKLDVVDTSMQLFWFILEHSSCIPLEPHLGFMYYGLNLLYCLEIMEDLYKLTAADRLIRSRIIAKGELVGLMGRILLLILSHESLFQETEYLEIIFKRLSALREIIGDSVTTAPRLFRDSKIEWAKVTKRLAAERHRSSTDRQSWQLTPRYITEQMWTAWMDFGASLVIKQKESHKC